MKKIRAVLKSRRGITLAELLVTVAIVSILLPATIGSMLSVIDSYTRIKNMADLDLLSANLENVISNQIAYGYGAKVADDGTHIEFEKYGAESVKLETRADGEEISILYMNGKPYFDLEYYNGIGTQIRFAKSSENDGVIIVTMNFSGRANHSTSFTVRPLSVA